MFVDSTAGILQADCLVCVVNLFGASKVKGACGANRSHPQGALPITFCSLTRKGKHKFSWDYVLHIHTNTYTRTHMPSLKPS